MRDKLHVESTSKANALSETVSRLQADIEKHCAAEQVRVLLYITLITISIVISSAFSIWHFCDLHLTISGDGRSCWGMWKSSRRQKRRLKQREIVLQSN